MLIFKTGKMSQAGIEPATYGSHTKQVSANLGPMLYQLSYRDHWFKASPRHFLRLFQMYRTHATQTARGSITLSNTCRACTQLVCTHMLCNVGLSLVIKTSNLLGLTFLYPKYMFNCWFLKQEKCLRPESNRRPTDHTPSRNQPI